MEKDFGFGLHHQLSPNLKRSLFHFDLSHAFRNPHSIEDTMLKSPMFLVSSLHQARTSEPTDTHDWFHGVPVLNSSLRQQNDRFTADTKSHGKRFLVFDRSGNKTTLIQLGGYRTDYPPASNEKLTGSVNSLRPSLAEENVEEDSLRDSEEDEMREDSEELDALLWSDNETDDNEEVSTGHSPSTMTDNGAQDLAEESGEEVNSVIQAAKRQKLMHVGHDLPSYGHNALEDNAESHLVRSEEPGSLSGNTRSCKEKTIHETVNILQRIIPNANGKSPVMVIDEAIGYLQSLQSKASYLGIDI